MISKTDVKRIVNSGKRIFLNPDYLLNEVVMVDKNLIPIDPGDKTQFQLIGARKSLEFITLAMDPQELWNKSISQEAQEYTKTEWIREGSYCPIIKNYRKYRLFRSGTKELYLPEQEVRILNLLTVFSLGTGEPCYNEEKTVLIMPVIFEEEI